MKWLCSFCLMIFFIILSPVCLAEQVKPAPENPEPETGETISLPDHLKWLDNMTIFGDFRYRFDHIDSETHERTRNRIRARIGLKATLEEEWEAGFRLASGSDDPVSTNQSLDEGFSTKDINLDLAYGRYQPGALENLTLSGGIIKNPYYRAGKNQLIWDSDLTFEGITGQYDIELSDTGHLFLNGGGFWVEEYSEAADQALWGLQAGVNEKWADLVFHSGLSYYNYIHLENRATVYDDEQGFGNTVFVMPDENGNAKTFYENDYDILELFCEITGISFFELPLSLYGNYVANIAADTSEDTGWLTGCTFNKAKKQGTWQVDYNYRDLEDDAVLGVFSDSDFIEGGTNGAGHTWAVKYMLKNNISVKMTYFLNVRTDHANDFERVLVDLILSF